MNGDKKIIEFNQTMIDLFTDMNRVRKEYGLLRVNSIILLKGLLEEEQSILYDCLAATSTINPYKQIILDCDEELKKMKGNENSIQKKDENKFKLAIPEEEISFYMTDNFKNILYKTYNSMYQACEIEFEESGNPKEQINKITLDTEHLFVVFMDNIPKDVLNILKNNGVCLDAIWEYYNLVMEMYEEYEVEYLNEEDMETDNLKPPKAISDFVSVLSAKYKGVKECEILGRDVECQKVMRILQKRGKKNAILIGEPGVGKSSIAEKIAFDIANDNCPDSLKGYTVLQLNVNSIIAGTKYRGMAEERFKILVNFLESHENVILFIDEIHMVIGAGATSNHDEGDMANALKPFLASKKAKIIGATTSKEFERCFARDEAFRRRFEKIIVKEPKAKEVYPMLKNAIKEHEKYHGVKISEEMVQYTVLISSCFNNNTHNPDRTNDLIDASMVIAKEKGKKNVDRDCVLENFDINFEKFKNLEYSEKKSTAYHEAGHYIVGRKSGKLLNWKGIAISILPAEEYLGVTVYDNLSDEVTVYPDRAYYIDYIARALAGRVAEEKYTKTINSGAIQDLKKANEIAYDLVCQYGMSKDNTNQIYIENQNYHMMSEKIRNCINKEVKEIIEEATERAKEIISQNEKLMERLVKELMEKNILDENDLEEICKEVDSIS